MTTEQHELIKEIDKLANKINESNVELITESKIFDTIKNKIKNFIEKNKEKISQKLPQILEHIKSMNLLSKYKKYLYAFIVVSLISIGFSFGDAKELFDRNDISKQIKWEEVQKEYNDSVVDLSVEELSTTFELGEYDISLSNVNRYYQVISNQLPDSVDKIEGEIVVTISKDPNNTEKRNFANDDTPQEKEKGGQLLQKRKKAATKFLYYLKKKFKEDGIEFNVDIITDIQVNREMYFESLKAVKDVEKTADYDKFINQGEVEDDNAVIPNKKSGGKGKNIKDLSRNYQFVELLKLGGIQAERFEGDNWKEGDEYSRWILNTRKHIKRFLSRLQREFPEYNIRFDKDVKAHTPVVGAKKGMSNIHQQYKNVGENVITNFDYFVFEKVGKGEDIFNKWKKILGGGFPELTISQAKKFENNIKTMLDYLEQMYGSTVLEFRYGKSYEKD